MIRFLGLDMPPGAAVVLTPVWCPTCGTVVRTCTWLGGTIYRPAAGMPALCGHCLSLNVFLGRGHYMRRATAADLVRLRGDADTWPVLRAQLVEEIRRRARRILPDPWQAERLVHWDCERLPPWTA